MKTKRNISRLMSVFLRTNLFQEVTRRGVKTYFGFPLDPSFVSQHSDGSPDKAESTKKMQGVALMMAVLIISIMMMFAADMIVSSTVDLTMAASERDSIKAEYVAKSGANWAIWLNLFDYGIDAQLSSSNDPMMKSAKGVIGPLWNKLDTIFSFDSPLDLTETQKFLAAFNMNALMDSKTIDLLQGLGGELGIQVEDEGGKINLNVCYQSTTFCKVIMAQVRALLTCTDVERDYFKQKNLKATEITAKIQDWIDGNPTAEPDSGASSEDDPYQKRVPSHKAKNSPLDTLDELKMIDGWNDELHAYFSPYLTPYPFVHSQDKDQSAYKLNINTMNQDILKCIFSKELNSPEAKENFIKKFKELMENNGQLASNDQDLNAILKDMIGYQVDGADKGKVEADKGSWLGTSSRVYRIKAKGIVGSQTKVVEYVLERQSIAQRKANPVGKVWRFDGYFSY